MDLQQLLNKVLRLRPESAVPNRNDRALAIQPDPQRSEPALAEESSDIGRPVGDEQAGDAHIGYIG
jgi:hypothetical protein